jgi:hypothetical protein
MNILIIQIKKKKVKIKNILIFKKLSGSDDVRNPPKKDNEIVDFF